MSPSSLRLDLHNHTHYSSDGLMSPAALLRAARAKGIGCLAVTDHNTVQGALQAVALSDADLFLPRVIPGIELNTADGEIIGLYVWEDIRPGLPLIESVELVRGQGGLVYLPHPFDILRRGTISRRQRTRAGELSDVVEVANGRSLGPRAGEKAARFAGWLGKAAGAGSDAHREAEVGLAWVEVDAYPTRDTLAELVAAGKVVHDLRLREYTMNWGVKGLAPVTRIRRRVADDLPRR
jgi:predicted metal-dependent phosphoesterase TrpH